MSRRKKKPYVSKWEKDAILITSKIINFEYKNKEVSDSLKNVFYLESSKYPQTGRMCVMWGRCNANEGDEIVAKGRINKDGVFLIWSFMIMKRNADTQTGAEQSEV